MVRPFGYLLPGPAGDKSRDSGAHEASKFWRDQVGVYCPIQSIFVVMDQSNYRSRPESNASHSCVGKQTVIGLGVGRNSSIP